MRKNIACEISSAGAMANNNYGQPNANFQVPHTVVVMSPKSGGLVVVLTIMFGGLGLLYADVKSGVIMLVIEVVALLLAIITFGFGLILFPIIHVICIIWGITLVNKYNLQFMQGRISQ